MNKFLLRQKIAHPRPEIPGYATGFNAGIPPLLQINPLISLSGLIVLSCIYKSKETALGGIVKSAYGFILDGFGKNKFLLPQPRFMKR
ncbi:hypothetical protein LguiB_028660 [Lonicera macranthoides]